MKTAPVKYLLTMQFISNNYYQWRSNSKAKWKDYTLPRLGSEVPTSWSWPKTGDNLQVEFRLTNRAGTVTKEVYRHVSQCPASGLVASQESGMVIKDSRWSIGPEGETDGYLRGYTGNRWL